MSAAIRSDAASRSSPVSFSHWCERPVGEVLGVRPPGAVAQLRIVAEPFGREVADRLEHRQARAGRTGVDLTHQALVHQRAEPVEHVDPVEALHAPRDGLDRFEGGAGEHGEEREQPLLVGGEQLVAPVDRVAQRPLAFRRVARVRPSAGRAGSRAARPALAVRTTRGGRSRARSRAAGRPTARRARPRPPRSRP